MTTLVFLFISFCFPISNGIEGEYTYVSKDIHHPTFCKLKLNKNQQFTEEFSSFGNSSHLKLKGFFKTNSDTLILNKCKAVWKARRKYLTKQKVINCLNEPEEFECQPDTFLIKEDGLHEFQYFNDKEKNGWILNFIKI